MAVVLLTGAALRLAALGKPLYIDEIVSVTVATQPLERMGHVMRLIDASPALSPLLLHGWLRLCDSDVWARLLMAILGWLTIPIAYGVGTKAFDRRTGIWAAFAVAIAPPLVQYSQYVRNYSLFTLLAAIHLAFSIRWLGTADPDPRDQSTVDPPAGRGGWPALSWGALVIIATAMIYTHYLALVYFVPAGLVALSTVRRRRSRAVGWVAAHALALLLFLPGVPLLVHNLRVDAVRNLERPRPAPAYVLGPNLGLELLEGQRALGFSDPHVRRGVLASAAVAFPTLLAIGALAGWRNRKLEVALLLATAILPPAVYVLSGRRLVAVRFFLPSLVAALVLIGHGLRNIPRRFQPLAAAVLVGLAAVPLWHFFRHFEWSYDHAAVAREIRASAQRGDIVLVIHPFEAFYYDRYLKGTPPVAGVTFTPLAEQAAYVIKPPPLEAEAAQLRVERLMAGASRAFVIGQSPRSFSSDADQQRKLLAWMDARYGGIGRLDSLTGGDPTIRVYRGGSPAGP